MPHSDETYIVRVRRDEGDAVVEEVRSRRRLHVHELSQLGAFIAEQLGGEPRFRSARSTSSDPTEEGSK